MRIGVVVGASVADMMTLDGLLARIKQGRGRRVRQLLDTPHFRPRL